jgi:plasmid stabilization system protein ParE
MATEIRWSEKASSNLQHIHDYIASDSPYYAERFITKLVLSVEKQLRNQPLSGRSVPEFDGTLLGYLREVIFKGYRIIYNPSKVTERITIIAVLNSKMDVPKQANQNWILD